MSKTNKQIHEIMEMLMSYARLDFSKKLNILEEDDELSAVAAGINMLGEELEENVVSLREKERLLKELHHRVKNNMQIIVSMLKLQTANEKDPKILALVRDSKSRIESMALVHEILYSSDGFEYTSLKEYVDFLQRSIFMSYAPPSHEISAALSVDENIKLKVDHMIPLGLILNEMFSNSLKHAFPNKKGKITVNIEKKEDGTIHIVYCDNGVGLPKELNIEKTDSLGAQLIFMLTEQLQGDLKYGSGKEESENKGLMYNLCFS